MDVCACFHARCVYVRGCLHARERVCECFCEHALVCVCSCVIVCDVWACVRVGCWVVWVVWLCGLRLRAVARLFVDGSISREFWDEDPIVVAVANGID